MRRTTWALVWCVLLSCATPALAGQLTNRSDTLGSSAIGVESSHAIHFTPNTTIPSSGTITITPESGAFSINPGLDYQDLDVLFNNTQQPLQATPGNGPGSALGVMTTTGTNGNIVITLNDTDSISSGSTVDILIGTIASYESAGGNGITNPNATGSYKITLATTDNSHSPLDASIVGVATTIPVGVSSTVNGNVTSAPTFNPPAGTYASNATITISTTTPGATIYYTTNGNTPTTSSTVYTTPVVIAQSTIIQALATAPGFTDSAISTASYTITTNPGSGGGSVIIPPYNPPVGGASINGDAGGLAYGSCSNGASIVLVVPAGAWSGMGYISLSCMPYSGFQNKTGAAQGDALADTIFGISIVDTHRRPIIASRSPLQAIITYTDGQLQQLREPFTAQQLNTTRWTLTPYQRDKNGNYPFNIVFTTIGSLSVIGTVQTVSCQERPADLNCDGRVNLTDFSILLYYWGKTRSHSRADINKDGIVNLIDFSILLYWWTS